LTISLAAMTATTSSRQAHLSDLDALAEQVDFAAMEQFDEMVKVEDSSQMSADMVEAYAALYLRVAQTKTEVENAVAALVEREDRNDAAKYLVLRDGALFAMGQYNGILGAWQTLSGEYDAEGTRQDMQDWLRML
jgi:hypothetical protein